MCVLGITAVKSAFGLLVGQPQSIQSLTVNYSLWRGFHLESNQGCVMFFLGKLLSFSANMSIALFRSSVQLRQLTNLQK